MRGAVVKFKIFSVWRMLKAILQLRYGTFWIASCLLMIDYWASLFEHDKQLQITDCD